MADSIQALRRMSNVMPGASTRNVRLMPDAIHHILGMMVNGVFPHG
jgi:hypothetical protein